MIGLRLRLSCWACHNPFVDLKKFQIQGVRLYAQDMKHLKLSSKARQVPRTRPAMKKRGARGMAYPLLVIPVTCLGLGVWQISRKNWKSNLIQDLEDKMNRAPVALPDNLLDLATKEMEYTRVVVQGVFDHDKEQFVGPRQDCNAKKTEMGVHVITPLKLSGRDETILVNRGHVPWKTQPHQLRQDGQIKEEVEFVGVVRRTEKKALGTSFMEEKHCYPNRDVEHMAHMAETQPVFVDADINSTVPGGPVGGQTRLQFRDEHLTYVFTWFSLAAITYFLWYRNYRNPRPHKSVISMLKQNHRKL